MKRKVFYIAVGILAVIALSCFIYVFAGTLPNNQPLQKTQLTLNKVKQLSHLGESLTWSDFENYESVDFGSGLYIWQYNLSDTDKYCLLIGGSDHPSKNEPPIYIRLIKTENANEYVDIRTDDIDEFIK